MISAQSKKAIELVSKIESARAEVVKLEEELDSLFISENTKVPINGIPEVNGKKPARNRLRVLKIFKNANGPLTCKDVQKKIGLSNSGTMYIIRQLIESGEVYSPVWRQYAFNTNSN